MIDAQLNRTIRRRSRAVVMWAMVPLALLSGRPVSGCICADGHYEPFCGGGPRLASDAASQQTAGDATGRGCSCCDKSRADDRNRSCCNAKTDCCRRSSSAHRADSSDARVAGKSCCTPVLRTDLVTIAASSWQLSDEQQLSVLCTAALALPSTGIATGAGQPVGSDTGPPPDDLVVTLRRLLI